MKILFICGSLESGMDGVGDYTRRLAGELDRQGHKTVLLSLNDRLLECRETERDINIPNSADLKPELPYRYPENPQTNNGIEAGFQTTDGTNIFTVRFFDILSWQERKSFLDELVKTTAPDWVSLQFVPYSFQAKGLPYRMPSFLQSISWPQGCRFHVMFHETWIGEPENSSFKYRVAGYIQKKIIKNLVRKVSPQVMHTNTWPYVEMLKTIGVFTSYLELFGNIPITTNDAWSRVKILLEHHSSPVNDRNDWYLGGIFGSVQPDWEYRELVARLQKFTAAEGKKLAIIFAGNTGKNATFFSRMLEDLPGIPVLVWPEKEPDAISAFFNTLDLGIATTTWVKIEKSGSVAAMLDHQLPVLVNREDIRYKQGWEPSKEVGEFLGYKLLIPGRQQSLAVTAELFTQSLISCPSKI